MIQFHNTLSGKLEEFKPLKKGVVTFYTCGPTVYHYAHIGNFRTFVFEDLLRRFLEFKGFKVRHVMNITDVDDKTIAGANREKKSLSAYTEYYTEAFLQDLETLNILSPEIQPRATEEIPAMIGLIRKLITQGIAYEADGSVYYRVAAFPKYGSLSKKKLEGNITGARVDVDEYDKEEGADFVLWKKAKEDEPSWDSPWGKGRPGWHIECSAMCMRHLGETVDIHAGGEDLVFPHHENEIAQSEAATGKRFVQYWLHAKHLLVNGEKMSKSKGNFFTLRDLLEKDYDPMAIRYALLSVHYRHQLNFTFESLKEARDAIEKMDNSYFQCVSLLYTRDKVIQVLKKPAELANAINLESELKTFWDGISSALEDDLNISAALSLLLAGVSEINRALAGFQIADANLLAAKNFFEKTDQLFGFDISCIKELPNEIVAALGNYSEARRSKNFETSDKLRRELGEKGWLVKDGRPGEPSTVKKVRRVWDSKK